MNKPAWRWAVGTAAVVLLLCCGGAFRYVEHSEAACARSEATARVTVRTDSKPIQAELKPLGTPSELHWVHDPYRSCGIMPIPGTNEYGSQTGVVRLDAAAASELLHRYAGWEPQFVGESDFPAVLSRYVSAGGNWQHSVELDAQFIAKRPREAASYYVDAAHGLVLFSSYADH